MEVLLIVTMHESLIPTLLIARCIVTKKRAESYGLELTKNVVCLFPVDIQQGADKTCCTWKSIPTSGKGIRSPKLGSKALSICKVDNYVLIMLIMFFKSNIYIVLLLSWD